MTTQIITELDSLINLMEAKLPANILRSENQKQAREFERALRKYFQLLEQAFPYDQLDQIYYRHVKESVGQESGDLIDTVLMSLRTDLLYRVNGYVAAIYISGTAQMTQWAGLPYEGPPMQQAIDYASKHCAKLVTEMDGETKSKLAKIISDGIKDKRGIEGLKRDIRKEFTDMSHYRARMISRTETNDALSQSFIDRGKELGINGKEIVGGDPCELCQDNINEGIVPLNHVFSSGHERPPFHPNAVFEGYGFFPYGSLQQMLRSRYNGPAISLEAERFDDRSKLAPGNSAYMSDSTQRDILGEKEFASFHLTTRNRRRGFIAVFPQRIQLTIGPNHPILTKRGFVDAQFLNEGDELLYDMRSELTAGGGTPDFKQVHSIEDIFESMGSLSGYTGIPTAEDYFHGDESFCYGEIQVIRPQGGLLPIRNSSIIEHLGKYNLMETYADAEHMASCSSCQFRFNSIFHSPPCYMCCFRISSIHKTSFIGWAFDASTSTQLYNIGGVVVKNCVCALAPAMIRE